MTVCGIQHADGVCVMGKCPYVAKCCPAVWDKSGKVEMTNEEHIRSCSTEELPKALKEMFFDIKSRVRSELGGYNELMKSERYFDEWLKEKHE